MMKNIQIVRGCKDLVDSELQLYNAVTNIFKYNCELLNYEEISTPVFEHSELFIRSNEQSDMVSKQMYTFLDKSDRSLTLRPEGTAPVIRAVVEKKLLALRNTQLKLFYNMNMYRYERPQSGRYREFRQIGVESLGESSYLTDLELLVLIIEIFDDLEIKIDIKLNSLGSKESQASYRNVLKDYFTPFATALCPDCQKRLLSNPLRILDCKVDADLDIVKSAPKISDYLSSNDKKRLTKLISSLKALHPEVAVSIDTNLVRGLDYYHHTVFEILPSLNRDSDLGALGGGGCYDNLVSELGGDNIKGSGFALGVDRIVEILKRDSYRVDGSTPVIYFIALDELSKEFITKLYLLTTKLTIKCQYSFLSPSLKSELKKASNCGAKYAIIIGSDELAKKCITIKNLEEQTQISIKRDEYLTWLNGEFNDDNDLERYFDYRFDDHDDDDYDNFIDGGEENDEE